MSLDRELAKLHEIVGTVTLPFDGKSLEEDSAGTLLVRGILATTGVDRMNERFDEPSLRKAFAEYFSRAPIVVHNHRLSAVLGKLTAAKFTTNGEIEVEAEILKPPPGDPLESVYSQIKAGVLRAFSIGGKWKRLPSLGGATKLFTTEVVEASITGVGVNQDALFEVVGTKSLPDLDGELSRLTNLTGSSSPLDEALAQLVAL